MRLWSEQEWFFLLSCYHHSANRKDANAKFGAKYKRTRKAIKRKFQRECILINTILGVGIGKGKVTKQQVVSELKQVYNLLGKPFSRKEFDEVSKLGSAIVIGYFGNWDTALEQANLTRKFHSHAHITNEKATFDPEKELR